MQENQNNTIHYAKLLCAVTSDNDILVQNLQSFVAMATRH